MVGPPFNSTHLRGATRRGRLAVQRRATVREGMELAGARYPSAGRGRIPLHD